MSCLFGLLGANVLGVELEHVPLEKAWAEADRWKLRHNVKFANYDGNPASISVEDYDYVFTKSVFVMIPELEVFLSILSQKLHPKAELMMAENLAGGRLHHLVRRYVRRRPKKYFDNKFRGVDGGFLTSINRYVKVIELRKYFGLVAAIRAQSNNANTSF